MDSDVRAVRERMGELPRLSEQGLAILMRIIRCLEAASDGGVYFIGHSSSDLGINQGPDDLTVDGSAKEARLLGAQLRETYG